MNLKARISLTKMANGRHPFTRTLLPNDHILLVPMVSQAMKTLARGEATEEDYTVLDTLASGLNPETDEALPSDHLCRNADVIDALLLSNEDIIEGAQASNEIPVAATEEIIVTQKVAADHDNCILFPEKQANAPKRKHRTRVSAELARKRWSDDDKKLVHSLVLKGNSAEAIGQVVGRSWKAITSLCEKQKWDVPKRNERLNTVAAEQPTIVATKKGFNADKWWTEAEENKLRREVMQEMLPEHIAILHGRSVDAITTKMKRMGLDVVDPVAKRANGN